MWKKIIFETAFPMVIVILAGCMVEMPENFDIALYIILFGITTAMLDRKRIPQIEEEQSRKKVVICAAAGLIFLSVLLILQRPLLYNSGIQTGIQIVLSLLCSICAVIILCTLILKWKVKRKGSEDRRYRK